MGNLLFSPSGRIGPGQFMSGVTVVIAITLVLALLAAFVPALGALQIIGLVLLYCWVVLWVKRYHDAGKSGWMCLVPIIVYIIAAIIVTQIIGGMFQDPDVAAAIEAATEEGDFGAIFAAASSGGLTRTGMIVSALANAAVSYVIAMVFNGMIKQDMGDNQYGPVPVG